MQSYIIQAYFRNGDKGRCLYTLGIDGEWYLACNKPLRSSSVQSARNWAKTRKVVENRPQLGSDTCPFITGPRGGRHSIFERN
jgi:hypothetical protein